MKKVHQIVLKEHVQLPDLLGQMAEVGVLGAGSLGQAYNVMKEVFEDDKYTVMLSLAGPLVASGLRSIIAQLIAENHVHVIITSGANIVHDIIEAIGHRHFQGSFQANDNALENEHIARIGNIFMEMESFTTFEDKIRVLFSQIPAIETGITPSELIAKLGELLDDPNSIVVQAAKHKVPIHSPGLLDSMLGFHLWVWSQTHRTKLDMLRDMDLLSNIINDAQKTAAIILGGGLPKHYTMGANILREGLDAAVQIVNVTGSDGSLSGAPLSEGIGWHKVKKTNRYATVYGDVTMLFPILVAALKN